MRKVIAKLKTRTMSNGHEVIKESVPLGKEYAIDLDSRRTAYNLNASEGRFYPCVVVKIIGAPPENCWMMLDLLETEDAAQC